MAFLLAVVGFGHWLTKIVSKDPIHHATRT